MDDLTATGDLDIKREHDDQQQDREIAYNISSAITNDIKKQSSATTSNNNSSLTI